MSTGVVLVAARARNGVIGDHGRIPWHVPADFVHFKRVTVGHPLILGRTTFEGIGRPLPDRQSIVVTRNRGWACGNVLVAHSFAEALDIGRSLDTLINVGGGGKIYELGMPHATHQILSEIDVEPPGDVYYPAFDEADWHETAREEHGFGQEAGQRRDGTPWCIRWLTRTPSR